MKVIVGLTASFMLLLFALSIYLQGPLPGDVWLTLTLQAWFDPASKWPLWLTATAKQPWVWLLFGVTLALAYGMSNGRLWLLPLLAWPLVKIADLAMRALWYVPKPDAELVAVAAASHASGLPSSFVLTYTALMGSLLLLPRRSSWHLAVQILAAALLLCGCLARIILAGHWPSQVLASLLFAGYLLWLLRHYLIRSAEPI